ncbi:MAG: UDP-N-acetylmuramoyl-tripeptide--D-alanyl-D-alanine ligase [Candidatus Marinimicrobia bacterium]|nr:UDP-N-acetylmuramoyl-tripeptide--D-alanyl-D-alanine ligase [Candidatus Neomarinimicrobiota bacterium]
MRVDIQNKSNFNIALNSILPAANFPDFSGISIDSRNVKQGDIFLAFKGESTDGHNFISQAESAGSTLAIVENNIETPLPTLQVKSTRNFLNDLAGAFRKNITCPLIGITGSNGKTTTKDLLTHVLSASMEIMSTRGNFNSTIGVPLSIFECGENVDAAIIEMGASMPGEIEYICNIVQPNMGLITNVYESHLEYFEYINEVAKTKSALFSSLPEDGVAFINIDDPFISKMSIPCKGVEYSFTKPADYRGNWSSGKKMLIINNIAINLSAKSETMGMNALAVFSIASHLGMDAQVIKSQIESFQLPVGRGNILQIQDIMVINDSYNANLESARTGINNLTSLYEGKRKIAVIGDMLEMGELEKDHHQTLGKYLSEKKVDAVFAFGDLTRHTIKAMNGAAIFHQYYDDKTTLLTDLKAFISEGDVVYVKGSRGMKMEDIIIGLQG